MVFVFHYIQNNCRYTEIFIAPGNMEGICNAKLDILLESFSFFIIFKITVDIRKYLSYRATWRVYLQFSWIFYKKVFRFSLYSK